MLAYIVRRVLYAIPILIGVNLITFMLFFIVNTPDDMARMQLGSRRVTPEAIEKWKAEQRLRQAAVVEFDGAGARQGDEHDLLRALGAPVRLRLRPVRRRARHRHEIRTRMWPSLALALPVFLVGLAREHHLRAAHGVLPRHLPRLLGRGAVRGDDVDLEPVLHHRRPVRGLASCGIWCRSRATTAASTRSKFLLLPVADRRDRRHRLGRTLVPHDVPRGDGQGLRAHGAREGPRRVGGAVPPRAQERA